MYLLQTNPEYISRLVLALDILEIDPVIHTIMFTLFGNHFDARDDYLLLTSFQVSVAV